MALALPGTFEAAHVGHPDFRIANKVFASLGAPDASWAMVKLTPSQQRALVIDAPGIYKRCNGAWGERGYTNIKLALADQAVVGATLQAAATNIASRPKKRKS